MHALREEFRQNVKVVGRDEDMNKALEFGLRVADYMEFAEMLVRDALDREESCGCHFREEYQTPDGEASATTRTSRTSPRGSTRAPARRPILHKEPLTFEAVAVKQRSYK